MLYFQLPACAFCRSHGYPAELAFKVLDKSCFLEESLIPINTFELGIRLSLYSQLDYNH